MYGHVAFRSFTIMRPMHGKVDNPSLLSALTFFQPSCQKLLEVEEEPDDLPFELPLEDFGH